MLGGAQQTAAPELLLLPSPASTHHCDIVVINDLMASTSSNSLGGSVRALLEAKTRGACTTLAGGPGGETATKLLQAEDAAQAHLAHLAGVVACLATAEARADECEREQTIDRVDAARKEAGVATQVAMLTAELANARAAQAVQAQAIAAVKLQSEVAAARDREEATVASSDAGVEAWVEVAHWAERASILANDVSEGRDRALVWSVFYQTRPGLAVGSEGTSTLAAWWHKALSESCSEIRHIDQWVNSVDVEFYMRTIGKYVAGSTLDNARKARFAATHKLIGNSLVAVAIGVTQTEMLELQVILLKQLFDAHMNPFKTITGPVVDKHYIASAREQVARESAAADAQQFAAELSANKAALEEVRTKLGLVSTMMAQQPPQGEITGKTVTARHVRRARRGVAMRKTSPMSQVMVAMAG